MGGAVESAVESVADVVQDVVIDPAKDLGRDVDDFVNEEIPGGWYTVGAVAGGTALGSGALGGAEATTGAFDIAGVGDALGGYYGAGAAAPVTGAFDVGGVGNAMGGYWGPEYAAGGAFEMGGVGDAAERFTNYVAPSSALKTTMDVLRTGNAIRSMFGQQPQAGIPSMQFNQVPQGVVDYSPLLSLLSQQATRPNVQSLLG